MKLIAPALVAALGIHPEDVKNCAYAFSQFESRFRTHIG